MKLRNLSCQLILGHYTPSDIVFLLQVSHRDYPFLKKNFYHRGRTNLPP